MNNQETLKNMKVRGTLSRILDLQKDKLDLMNMAGAKVTPVGGTTKRDTGFSINRALKVPPRWLCNEIDFPAI